jgi:hypothetical protein
MTIILQYYHVREANVFYGGDEFSGYVECRGPLKIPDATVEVGLSGYSETVQPIRNRTLDDKAIFFQTTKILFHGDLDIENGNSQTFPFTFQLPVETDPPGGNAKIKYSKKECYAKAPHPIPPSVALSGRMINREWVVQVNYPLQAQVKKRKGDVVRKKVWNLTIVPHKTAGEAEKPKEEVLQEVLQEVNSKYFTVVSSRLLSDQAQRRRSVNKWLSDKVASDTPRAVFSFTARTVTTLIAGQDIPIILKIAHDAEKSTVPSVPAVNLLEVKYKIIAYTQLVSRGTLAMDMQMDDKTTVFKRLLRFQSLALADGENLEVAEAQTDGSQRLLSLDAAIIPPFTTYNVNRRYEAELTIAFECGGKQMKAVFTWKPVTIVYNESYAEKPATQFGAADPNGDKALMGAARMVVTAATVFAVAFS